MVLDKDFKEFIAKLSVLIQSRTEVSAHKKSAPFIRGA